MAQYPIYVNRIPQRWLSILFYVKYDASKMAHYPILRKIGYLKDDQLFLEGTDISIQYYIKSV